MDFVKDHEDLYDKTNKHFKDKARKNCLWEGFPSSHNLSVKVCKTWFFEYPKGLTMENLPSPILATLPRK